MAKPKHIVTLPKDNDKRIRLRELEAKIQSWKCTGRLWDMEDEHVAETLEERDKLFYEVNSHLTGLSFNDMTDEDWEKIDEKVKDESEQTSGD